MTSIIKLAQAFRHLPENIGAYDTEQATAFLIFAGSLTVILASLFTIVISTACANTVRNYYDRV